MRFHVLDLLSDSPRNFIFRRETNKTNFSGFLTIIFFIVFLSISLLYILDYIDSIKNGEYMIEYLLINNYTFENDTNKMNEEEIYNPNKTFFIEIYDNYGEQLNDNFILYDNINNEFLKKIKNSYYKINRKLTDINLSLYYNCSNYSNCNIKIENEIDNNYLYRFKFYFAIPNITHQDNSAPINENELISKGISVLFRYDAFTLASYNWENTIYEEESTLFDRFSEKKKEYNFWDVDNGKIQTFTLKNYTEPDTENKNFYKEIVNFATYNNHYNYVSYKRKRITFLDTLVKLTSLFPTLYKVFQFVYNYYSKNFNNYKLIEKVLQMNNQKYRQIKLNNILYKNENTTENKKRDNIIKDLEDIEYDVDIAQILNDSNENNRDYSRKESLIQIENDSEINNEEDELLQVKIMPKFSFIQFFCNNLYFNRCSKFRKQEFLHICNQIMLKYLSIDSILYYQMKLENMLIDYKWNFSILNNIEKNKLIKKLKNV